jgi:hypothetical protein
VTEELNLPCRYKVTRDPLKESYKFLTDTGAVYEILFVEENQIFSATVLEGFETYNFVINKLESGEGKMDPEIKSTISAIIEYFFQNKDRILIYVYDSQDGKASVRKRLFDIWACNNKLSSSVLKIDNTIKTDDLTYHTGMLYHKDNSAGKQNITDSISIINHILTSEK